jgi:hypothetical protein
LFDGATVLQEDSVLTNTTNLWGFFAGSLDDYGCGGHPAQPAVPRTSVSGSDNLADYIQNEIWSPHIRLDEDVNQLPVPLSSSVTLEFDVYRDLPLDNLVFLQWRVRSIRDGCAGEWRNHDFVYYGAQKQWQRLTFELFPLIEPGASHIQVALGAVDLCFRLCGILGTGNCHSHAPLFDNVTVKARIPFDYTVINTLDAGAGSLREAITAAVALPDRNLIRFDIPGPGPHTIYPDSALPDISEPVIIDGTTQAGYAGGPVVALSGVNAGDVHGLKLEANRSVIKGLAIHNFARNGIFVTGDDDTLRGNYIGLTCAQAPGPNGRSGILLGVFNPWIYVDGTIIGGDQAHLANTIAYNAGDGVEISRWAGQGNAIRGNSIHSNDNLGIDIYGNGVTANDALDADGGPNSFQNYPVLDSAFAVANTIEGTLNSIPNRDFAIDFYANAACDTLGYGEGERYVGSTMVVTGGDGNISFTVAVPAHSRSACSFSEHAQPVQSDDHDPLRRTGGRRDRTTRCIRRTRAASAHTGQWLRNGRAKAGHLAQPQRRGSRSGDRRLPCSHARGQFHRHAKNGTAKVVWKQITPTPRIPSTPSCSARTSSFSTVASPPSSRHAGTISMMRCGRPGCCSRIRRSFVMSISIISEPAPIALPVRATRRAFPVSAGAG